MDEEKRYYLVKKMFTSSEDVDAYEILDSWYLQSKRGCVYERFVVEDENLLPMLYGEEYYDNPYGSNYSYDELGYFVACSNDKNELEILMQETVERNKQRLNQSAC